MGLLGEKHFGSRGSRRQESFIWDPYDSRRYLGLESEGSIGMTVHGECVGREVLQECFMQFLHKDPNSSVYTNPNLNKGPRMWRRVPNSTIKVGSFSSSDETTMYMSVLSV